MLKPNSPHYGRGVPHNPERMDVRFGCEHDEVYTVPDTNTMSPSILSSKQLKSYDRSASPVEVPVRAGVRCATIAPGDRDNTSYMLDLFSRNIYISHPHVHRIPSTWIYPPALRTNMVPVHNWYQKNLPTTSCYVGALSGASCTFPSRYEFIVSYLRTTNGILKDYGMQYMVLMDGAELFTGSSAGSYETFTKRHIGNLPGMKGLLYMNYLGCAKWQGTYSFVGDVSVVSFRYFMKNDDKLTESYTPETIVAALNPTPRSISGIDAYSAIVVHVSVPFNRTMEDMLVFKNLLNENIVLVNAEQFFELIRENVKGNRG